MDVQLDPKKEQQLRELAALQGKPAEALAAELIAVGMNGEASPSTAFHDQDVDLDELTANTPPVTDLDALGADFWPEDESVDDFVAAVRQWRHEKS